MWGVPSDTRYAAAQAVHHSQELHDALAEVRQCRPPREVRPALDEAATAVNALLALRRGWVAHWQQQQGATSVSDRAISEEFPQPATVATWPDREVAETAMLQALPALDRLQRALAAHTGQTLGQPPST
jgi:hypothetical protein